MHRVLVFRSANDFDLTVGMLALGGGHDSSESWTQRMIEGFGSILTFASLERLPHPNPSPMRREARTFNWRGPPDR
jgi:hypothetical protein